MLRLDRSCTDSKWMRSGTGVSVSPIFFTLCFSLHFGHALHSLSAQTPVETLAVVRPNTRWHPCQPGPRVHGPWSRRPQHQRCPHGALGAGTLSRRRTRTWLCGAPTARVVQGGHAVFILPPSSFCISYLVSINQLHCSNENI